MMFPLPKTRKALSLLTLLLEVYPINYHHSAMKLCLHKGKHLNFYKKSYLPEVFKACTNGERKEKNILWVAMVGIHIPMLKLKGDHSV